VREGAHRQEIDKFAGPQKGVICSVSPAERVVADKAGGGRYSPSGLSNEAGKLTKGILVVMAVVNVSICVFRIFQEVFDAGN